MGILGWAAKQAGIVSNAGGQAGERWGSGAGWGGGAQQSTLFRTSHAASPAQSLGPSGADQTVRGEKGSPPSLGEPDQSPFPA